MDLSYRTNMVEGLADSFWRDREAWIAIRVSREKVARATSLNKQRAKSAQHKLGKCNSTTKLTAIRAMPAMNEQSAKRVITAVLLVCVIAIVAGIAVRRHTAAAASLAPALIVVQHQLNAMLAVQLANMPCATLNVRSRIWQQNGMSFIDHHYHVSNDSEWALLFRLSKARFNKLVADIGPALAARPQNRGLKETDAENAARSNGRKRRLTERGQIALFLHRMAHGTKFRHLAMLFNISQATASHYFYHVLFVYVQKRRKLDIRWPRASKRRRLAQMMRRNYGVAFERCIASVDGTCFFIHRPKYNQRRDYNGQKKRHVVKAQGVVTDTGEFIHVVCGEHGTRHDSMMFNCSELCRRTLRFFGPHVGGAPRYKLLADTAYGLRPYTLTPYSKPAVRADWRKKKFNKLHSRARVPVENAFANLKVTWGIFLNRVPTRRSKVNLVVMAAFMLTNRLNGFVA